MLAGRGLASGRDRHRRLADRRAPPPPGGADRAGRARRAPARAARSRRSTCSAACTPAPRTCCATAATARPPGLTIARERRRRVPRGVPRARRRRCSRPRTSCPRCASTRSRQGDALSLDAGRGARSSSRRSAPATRAVSLLVPAAHARPTRARSGEGRHVALHASAPAAPARAACASAAAPRCPAEPGEPVDAAVRLEVDRCNGAVSPRLVLRQRRRRAAPRRRSTVLGEPASSPPACCARARPRRWTWPRAGRAPGAARRRAAATCAARGIAGLLADLVATGEPVLVVDRARAAPRARARGPRRAASRSRSWAALDGRSRPGRAVRRTSSRSTRRHPALRAARTIRPARAGPTWRGVTPELDFAHTNTRMGLRPARPAGRPLPRPARGRGGRGEACEARAPRRGAAAAVRGARGPPGAGPHRAGARRPRSRRAGPARWPSARSAPRSSAPPAFLAYQRRLEDGRRYLTQQQHEREQRPDAAGGRAARADRRRRADADAGRRRRRTARSTCAEHGDDGALRRVPADLTPLEHELLADLFAIVSEHADEVAEPVDRQRASLQRVRVRLRAPRRPAPPVRRGLHHPPGRRGQDLRRHAAGHRDAVRRAAARHRRGHDRVAGRGPRGSSARRSPASSTA